MEGAAFVATACRDLDKILGRSVLLVGNVQAAILELRTGLHCAMLTELFMFYSREGIRQDPLRTYLNFLEETMSSGTPIYVYSTQDEKAINSELGLSKGNHYNGFFYKWNAPFKELKELFDKIDPRQITQ